MAPIGACRDSENNKEKPSFEDMLIACTSVQIDSEDGLPKLICPSCLVQLENAYSFKEQCKETDLFLRNYLQNIQKVSIKEEAVIADEEFTSDLIGEMNSGLTDDIKDDVKIQPEVYQEEDMHYSQVINNSTTYECKTCCKIFYTLQGLKCHKRLHTGKKFKSKQCDRSYNRLNNLLRHQLSHSKRKMHARKISNKTLMRSEDLKHNLVTHLKEEFFDCPNCNLPFNHAEHLQNHIICCKGPNGYISDICNKALPQGHLIIHKPFNDTKVPTLPTLGNSTDIEEHYIKIDFDKKGDQSDGEDLDVTVRGTIKPEIEVPEDNDKEKIDDIGRIGNEIYLQENPSDMLLEQVKIKEELLIEDDDDGDAVDEEASKTENGNNYEFGNSAHSEYQPKIKRCKGRPHKQVHPYKSASTAREHPLMKLKIKSEIDLEIVDFQCPECKIVFTKMNLLKKHVKQHRLKMYECETCNKQFPNPSSLKRHKQSHDEVKEFLCATCEKCFSRRDYLQKHMKLHLRSDIFTCDLCQATFNRKGSLTKHKVFKHNLAERKFKCNSCPKAFTTERYRDSHSKTHLVGNKFHCRICEEAFISKSHLSEHMKVHNDSLTKFLCSECGQKFIRQDYYMIHMRRHRGEKPFKCKFCGKGFAQNTDLTVHERYHTGEKTHLCVTCGKGFGRACDLTVHMRTHTGEKPYRCKYCDAAFTQGHGLKSHIRRHTGEQFQCELCPEKFFVGYLLTQHKRVVHGLNIVSNIRRLEHVKKLSPDDPPSVTVPLPEPIVVATAVMSDPLANDIPRKK